jgi:hypothetical protein
MILPISVSQVVRIIDVSHHAWLLLVFLSERKVHIRIVHGRFKMATRAQKQRA